MEFHCDSCGICCEHVIDHPDIPSHDGVCDNLDRSTHLCTKYEDRPLVCRVVDGYDLIKEKLSEGEYLSLNYAACQTLKEKYHAKQV